MGVACSILRCASPDLAWRFRLPNAGLAGQTAEYVEIGEIFTRFRGLHRDPADRAMTDCGAAGHCHRKYIGEIDDPGF
jgi:hypothetical protein